MAAHTFCLSSSGSVLPASMVYKPAPSQNAPTKTLLQSHTAMDHFQHLPSMAAHTLCLSSSGAVLSASPAFKRSKSQVDAKTTSKTLTCDPMSTVLNSTATSDLSSVTSTPVSELSDGQLPPPYTTSTPGSSICDSDTAQLSAIHFKEIPDPKLFVNALEDPAARSTANLYAIANNTQYAMQAWQDEYDILSHEIKKRETKPQALPIECKCKKTCGHRLSCRCEVICKCKGYILPKLPSGSVVRKGGGRPRGDNRKSIAKALEEADAKVKSETVSTTPSGPNASPESSSGRSQRARKEARKVAENGDGGSASIAASVKPAIKRKNEFDEAEGEAENRGKKRLATLVAKAMAEVSDDDAETTRPAPPTQEAAQPRRLDVASLLNAQDVAPKTVLGKRSRETAKDLTPKTDESPMKRRRSLTKASIAAIIDHDDGPTSDRVTTGDAMPTVEGRRPQRRRVPPKTPTWLHEEEDDEPAQTARTRSHTSQTAIKSGSEAPLITFAPIAPLLDASLQPRELNKKKSVLSETVSVAGLTSQSLSAANTSGKKADATASKATKPIVQKKVTATSGTRVVDPEKSAKMQQVWARRKAEGKSGRYGTAPLNKEAGETLKTKHPDRIADFQARKAAGMVGTRKRKSATKTEDEDDDDDDDDEGVGKGFSKKVRTSR